MVGGIAKGVDLEFGEEILGKFLEQPVDHQAPFDAALGV